MPKTDEPGAVFRQYARLNDAGEIMATHEFRVGRELPYENLVDYTDLFPCDVNVQQVKATLGQRFVAVKAETAERKRKETKGNAQVTPEDVMT